MNTDLAAPERPPDLQIDESPGCGGQGSRKTALRAETNSNTGTSPEVPPHCTSHRAFIVWAVGCGFCRPERLTEYLLAELAAGGDL